jgi:hypothetical protein
MTMAATYPLNVAALCSAVLLAGCTWVKIPEEAQAVAIVEKSHITTCRELGNVSTQVKWKVAGVARNADKVRGELDDLARQQALELDADTLVRESVSEGQGRYRAYRCQP